MNVLIVDFIRSPGRVARSFDLAFADQDWDETCQLAAVLELK